jgi:glycosyltransferase involved in cell wall biosynthesis
MLMRVLFFGVYDPEYMRNRMLARGLAGHGVQVMQCNSRRAGRLAWAWDLLCQHWRLRHSYDVMLVAFPGQEAMFLARLLAGRRPIVFDAFSSHYGGYILDRKKAPVRSFRARWYRFLDRWSCRLATRVLLDTQVHIDFFVKEFGLSRHTFRRVWVGTDAMPLPAIGGQGPFHVLFFGSYIPLQGIPYIVEAARIIEGRDRDIRIEFIGHGQERPRIERLIKEKHATNITMRDTMPLDRLRQQISRSDICLGIFGDTLKTRLVIPNKVYEGVALGRPVITADTPAIRELFTADELVLVPTANAQALADAIIRLRHDPALRESVAKAGHQKFISSATPELIGRAVASILKELCAS